MLRLQPISPSTPTTTKPSSSSPSPSSNPLLHLLSLLLRCAHFLSTGDLASASTLLSDLSELSSPFGSPPHRLAAYFSDALRYKLHSLSLSLKPPPPLPTSETLTSVLFHSRVSQAFNHFNAISPLVKFSHFTSNQAIFGAVEREDFVHVVDLDVMQGLQWPGLFHILAARPAGERIKSLRITGFGANMDLLQATGRRLQDFAAGLGLTFEFRPVSGGIDRIVDSGVFEPREDVKEVVIVHWMQHRLYDVAGSDKEAIRALKRLRPKLISLVEQDLNLKYNPSGGADEGNAFMERFVEALHYYSALFDALGDNGGSAESLERHIVERQVLGCEIRNVLGERIGEEEKLENWGKELSKEGFRPVSLSGSPAAQASLLLGMYPWKGYTLLEDNGCLKLGWKNFSLLTASAWQSPPATDGDGGEAFSDCGNLQS